MHSAAPRLAILGATGHIGRSLLAELAASEPILAFARAPGRVETFAAAAGLPPANVAARPIEAFAEVNAEVVINCIGVGDPARVRELGAGIFRLTERFDDLVLDWIGHGGDRLYVNMSSGAVYGTDFDAPATEGGVHAVPVNRIGPERHYALAKLNAEAKHRALAERSIVDLRVFSYFSRFIGLDGSFFLAEAMNSLTARRELVTTPAEMTRDHVVPADLAALVHAVVAYWSTSSAPVNAALDVHSRGPVGKFALLDTLEREFGLRYRVDAGLGTLAPTGRKSEYYSTRAVPPCWGYRPRFDSAGGVVAEVAALLGTYR